MKIIIFLCSLLVLTSFALADFGYNNLDGPIMVPPINYSLIPTVNSTEWWHTNIGALDDVNSAQFDNIAGTLTIDTDWVDSQWCELTGCDMTGDLNTTGDVQANTFTLDGETITSWDDDAVGTNISINYGANETNTSGPVIPFLLTNEGVLKIEPISITNEIWEQDVNEIKNINGDTLNFTGDIIASQYYYVGSGAYIGYNATCEYILYNSVGSVIEAKECT